MTTYQMISDETGADIALVIKVKKSIIGNRHKATTQEVKDIIREVKRQVTESDSITTRA